MMKTFTIAFLILLFAIGLGLNFWWRQPSEYSPQFHQAQTGSLPYFLWADVSPIWANDPEYQAQKLMKLPELVLKNQNNQMVSLHQGPQKILILNFFFTSCGGFCPRQMAALKPMAEKINQASPLYIYSISVTPEQDQPSVLKKYAEKLGLSLSHWQLLTGDKKAIYAMARQSLKADTEVDSGQTDQIFLHSEHLYLIDQRFFVRGIYNGNSPAALKQMQEDIGILMASSSF